MTFIEARRSKFCDSHYIQTDMDKILFYSLQMYEKDNNLYFITILNIIILNFRNTLSELKNLHK